ncbi:unnamed protein product [Prunus armeniaca]
MKAGKFSSVFGELRGRRWLRLVGTGRGKDDGSNGSGLVADGSRWRWLWRRKGDGLKKQGRGGGAVVTRKKWEGRERESQFKKKS